MQPQQQQQPQQRLALTLIRLDGGTQSRAALDPFVIDEYALALEAGAQFPAIVVFYDGTEYWLGDGFHRVRAAQQAGLTGLEAEVRQGTRREAILYAVGANARHGLRRTNADKRRAVETLLNDSEWQQWSDTEIARRCLVSQSYVWKLRQQQPLLSPPSPLSYHNDRIAASPATSRLVTRKGTTYPLTITNLGQAARADRSTPTPPAVPEPEPLSEPLMGVGPQVHDHSEMTLADSPLALAQLPQKGAPWSATPQFQAQTQASHPHLPQSQLIPQTVALLRHSPLAESPEQKLALARLEPQTQLAVAARLAQGHATSVQQALKAHKIEQAQKLEEVAWQRHQQTQPLASPSQTQFATPSGKVGPPTVTLVPSASPSPLWYVTNDQEVVKCQVLIADPPYGVLPDQSWEPEGEAALETFSRQWATRWGQHSQAKVILIFWSERYLWQGRRWFDESLAPSSYQFQQLLIWHYPNGVKPKGPYRFKNTFDPILCYVKKPEGAVGAGETEEGEKLAALQIRIGIKEVDWNKGLNSFDCHVGAVPQSNYSGAELKQHPAQKPVSVYEWLIAATTQPGELVCDPFCGSGTAGIAALRLKRRFQGIETDPHYLELAQRRIAAYGTSGAGVETEAEVAPTPFALEPDLEEPEPGELELDLEARGSAATTHQTSLS